MKTQISKDNPFGANRYGFLWETLAKRRKGVHLDFGTFCGDTLVRLIKSGVIEKGIGIDINQAAIGFSAANPCEGISLHVIKKDERLPFEDESFDSISILDVLEHIHDQEAVLKDIHRLLKRDGIRIVTVPQKHVFSALDIGNLKFIFPRLHKIAYSLLYSKEEYRRRYIECENGLFGDIELEKMWHQHFSESELGRLLNNCGFEDIMFDGCGLFVRPLGLILCLSPFLKAGRRLLDADARCFESANLFCAARPKQST